jgi:hypothetical protein
LISVKLNTATSNVAQIRCTGSSVLLTGTTLPTDYLRTRIR